MIKLLKIQGTSRYDRLQKKMIPKMWNLTVRIAITPFLDGLQDVFLGTTEFTNQKQIDDITSKDLRLGKYSTCKRMTTWLECDT